MRATWVKRLYLQRVMAGVLLLLLLGLVPTVRAQDGCIGEGCGTPVEPACQGPACASNPGDPGDPNDPLTDPGDPADLLTGLEEGEPVLSFLEFVKYLVSIIMDFAIDRTTEGLQVAIDNTAGSFARALDVIVDVGVTNGGQAVSARPAWNVMLNISLMLLPATLALTAVSAMRSGAASVLGYADLKEALLNWFISAGIAAASFYLIGLAHSLSLATGRAILTAGFGAAEISNAMFGIGLLEAGAFLAMPPMMKLFLILFVFFFALTMLLSLGLALASFTALIYILTVLAPVVIVLGALPPLRWLHFLWSKALVITFMLPAINALLLRAASTISFNIHAGAAGGFAEFLVGVFVSGGLVSVLIAINYKVGEFVFGVLMEVQRKAWSSTKAVAGMALSVAGAAAGFAVGGAAASGVAGRAGGAAAGKTALRGSPSGGSGPSSAPIAATGSGPSGNGHAQSNLQSSASNGHTNRGSRSAAGNNAGPSAALAHDPQLRQRTAQHVARAGQALAMGSRNPFLRGAGLGAMVGGSQAGMQAGNELDAQRGDRSVLTSAARTPGGTPPELSRPHYNAQGPLREHLRKNVPEASYGAAEKLNTRMYGALHKSAAGKDDQSLVEGRQGLFTAYSAGNESPRALRGELNSWSKAHDVPLPSGWERDVNALFPAKPSTSQPASPGLSPATNVTPASSVPPSSNLTAEQIRDRISPYRGGRGTQ